MPIIASQHKFKDSEHKPLSEWPDDCVVQWGGRGVVLSSKPGGNYRTAFFEAFPKGGGFIRGEGATIEEAETRALEQYRRSAACEHQWSRGKYKNGGAICRKCKGFETVFKPIVTLGSFRKPLEPSMICMAAEGDLRPAPDDPQLHRFLRRNWLRARRMGIALPDFESAPPDPGLFREDDYALSCHRAVIDFLRANREVLESDTGHGIDGLFGKIGLNSIRRMLHEADEADASADLDSVSGPLA